MHIRNDVIKKVFLASIETETVALWLQCIAMPLQSAIAREMPVAIALIVIERMHACMWEQSEDSGSPFAVNAQQTRHQWITRHSYELIYYYYRHSFHTPAIHTIRISIYYYFYYIFIVMQIADERTFLSGIQKYILNRLCIEKPERRFLSYCFFFFLHFFLRRRRRRPTRVWSYVVISVWQSVFVRFEHFLL